MIVWGGANNYIFNFVSEDPADVVDDIKHAIEDLEELGARRFLVPNLPDLGAVPFAQAEVGLPELLSALTNQHNGLLTAMIAGLREDLEVEIIELDIHTSFNELLTSGAFPMVAIPCLIQDAEDGLDGQGDLADAIARSYFKLLSYKDEYEVARLHTQTGFLEMVRENFGEKAKLRFHMAPPLISRQKDARGRPMKKEFGSWMVPMFRIMASLRGLRGTKLDLFGLFPERRMERALIGEFEATVERLLSVLDGQNIREAEAVVRLYMDIRGYGPVKEQAADEVRSKIAAHAIMQV